MSTGSQSSRSLWWLRGPAGTTLVLVALAAGCSDTSPAEPEEGLRPGSEAAVLADISAASGDGAALQPAAATAVVSGDAQRQLAELRRATARFHQLTEARGAGYTVLVRHPESGAACLEDPTLGGMGRHFLDPTLVDDEVSVGAPEVVIYEPGPNGKLRLVGVEYIIPFAIRGMDEEPPVLFGQEFKQNHTFDLWALHAWVWKNNPAGMFADWNSRVSCQHDDAVAD